MSATEHYKRSVIIKALVVPLVVTLIVVVAFFALRPAIQRALPDASSYEQVIESVNDEVIADE